MGPAAACICRARPGSGVSVRTCGSAGDSSCGCRSPRTCRVARTRRRSTGVAWSSPAGRPTPRSSDTSARTATTSDHCLRPVSPASLHGIRVSASPVSGETARRSSPVWRPRIPSLRGRVGASGGLAPEAVAAHLRACDLVVQPFPDGVTTRHTSLMASLANGCPTVTTIGPFTEPLWADESGVALAPVGDTAALVDLVVALLRDDGRRSALGRAGHLLYDTRFAVRHTVRQLSDQPGHPYGRASAGDAEHPA